MKAGRTTWRALVLVALSVAGCSRPLSPQAPCDFVQNPELQRVSWKTRLPVELALHSSVPTEAYPAIEHAIAEYNAKLGREVFRLGTRNLGGGLNPGKDGASVIYWFDRWDNGKGNEQARTTIYWSGTRIFEADVRINAENFTYNYDQATSFSGVDLDSLLVHEFGHVLGLAHNADQGSVMNVSLARGEDRRDLSEEDLANLKCEY